MSAEGILVGIHGLENKPPRDEKRRWWRAAVVEGLQRNCGHDGGTFSFEFVYWAAPALRSAAPRRRQR